MATQELVTEALRVLKSERKFLQISDFDPSTDSVENYFYDIFDGLVDYARKILSREGINVPSRVDQSRLRSDIANLSRVLNRSEVTDISVFGPKIHIEDQMVGAQIRVSTADKIRPQSGFVWVFISEDGDTLLTEIKL